MSTTREVYAGKYLRVWMPTTTITDEGYRICPKCKKELGHYEYCPSCGTETEATKCQEWDDPHDLFEEIFDDVDRFMAVGFPGHDIVLPNTKQDCGKFLDDEDEVEFSNLEFNEDWKKLMEVLDKRNIRYEIHNGVVSFLM